MSDTPIKDALSKPIVIPDVPDESVTLAVEASGQDKGASVTVNKDLGQPGGWFVQAVAGWWESVGWSAKGVLGWRGKPKT